MKQNGWTGRCRVGEVEWVNRKVQSGGSRMGGTKGAEWERWNG